MSKRNGLAHRLYTGEISYDFIGNAKRFYIVSAIILVICLASLGIRNLNLSIDFTGGSEFVVPTKVTQTTVDDYTTSCRPAGCPIWARSRSTPSARTRSASRCAP